MLIKKILIILGILLAVFVVVWTVKLRTPITPYDPYAAGLSGEVPWWKANPNAVPETDDDWKLDHDIPENYIPVLGGDELYMEVGEDGKIIRYRHRTLQEDGSWLWETVDPNIPENYEPVDGLENVYRVVDANGETRYYRYTRNDDDTYFFTEVDKNGNPLQNYILSDDDIPANFVRLEGTNVYAVYNEYGVLVGYKERVRNDDGTYSWYDVDVPVQTQSGDEYANGSGSIPSVNGGSGNGSGSSITIIGGDVNSTERGYTEEKTYTDIGHADGWVIVYETIVTKTYDSNGDLVSTKTDGPNEINRIPETEWNGEILANKDR